MVRVGVHSIGVHLPAPIRRNDWWPKSVVDGWLAQKAAATPASVKVKDPSLVPLEDTSGTGLMKKFMMQDREDPFGGAVERHVLSDDQLSSDMEIAAGREAIERAGIDPQEIDLLLVTSACPDYLQSPNAPLVHRRLGLRNECLSLTLVAMCNGFLQQLTVADQMIRAGGARRALLIQSSLLTRLVPPDSLLSTRVGDGATAAVVGPVADGLGVLGQSQLTDGSVHGGIVCGVPGKRWYEEGRIYSYHQSSALQAQMVMGMPDLANEMLDGALAQAHLTRKDIAFWACHRATNWMQSLIQEHCGLSHAATVNTYPYTGTLTGANIPISLSIAERDGRLRPGMGVAMFASAAGQFGTCTVMRWGAEAPRG